MNPATDRHLFLVGNHHRDVIRLARRCAWGPNGGHWMTPEDHVAHLLGARTTHGLCPEHAAAFLARLAPEHDPNIPAA